MTDTHSEDSDFGEDVGEDNGDGTRTISDKQFRAMREAANKSKVRLRDLNATTRELAFFKAGVDVTTKLGEMFAKGYDGEMDADAIRAAAEEVGIKPATAAAPAGGGEQETADEQTQGDPGGESVGTGAEAESAAAIASAGTSTAPAGKESSGFTRMQQWLTENPHASEQDFAEALEKMGVPVLQQ